MDGESLVRTLGGRSESKEPDLINVYWSLKEEEKEVMKRIKKTARNMKKATLLIGGPLTTYQIVLRAPRNVCGLSPCQ